MTTINTELLEAIKSVLVAHHDFNDRDAIWVKATQLNDGAFSVDLFEDDAVEVCSVGGRVESIDDLLDELDFPSVAGFTLIQTTNIALS